MAVTVKDLLSRSEPFSALPADTQLEIVAVCREIGLSKGQFVFRLGEPSKDLFVLAEGSVGLGFGEVSAEESSGGALSDPGEVIGWGALVGATNYRMINAICVEDTRLVAIEGLALMSLLERSPAAGFAFLRKLLTTIFNRMVSLAAT
jgi:toluene monooxygenase system ferredoxin subunit